ncbi:formylglycine-generating enzyme family protein [bacterium]|nr:formylglycine-generating enzyme family protein [bacterium]
MRLKSFFLTAVVFFMVGATLADTVTQEVVNVQKYVKGSTTLKLSGTLSETAIQALAEGKSSVSVCNNLGSYLFSPTLIPEGKNGYGLKTDSQKISVKLKNGKFSWTVKDVAANFAFVIGTETIKPDKAALKSSGTIDTKDIDNFKTQKATVLDILSYEKGQGSVAAYTFTPESTGNNFKHANKGTDLQVKFSANSKGKATATFKLLPNAASPAFVSDNSIAPTNLPPVDPTNPPVVTNRLYMVIDLSGGPDAESYPISYLNGVPEGGWTEEYKTTKMVLSKINAGKFTMGGPENELGRQKNEVQHEVTLTQPFYAGVFEVTQKQYELVTGNDPSLYKGDARPVEYVSYNMLRGTDKGAAWPANNDVDETSFFGILRAKTGLNFDLPTEAQWEFACRAGTVTALNSGKNLTATRNCPNMSEVGFYHFNGGGDEDESGNIIGTSEVGLYLPNAWGLYDMHGNVYEWCLDWDGKYVDSAVADPKGPESGDLRMLRGGGLYSNAFCCRSAYRWSQLPSATFGDYGFRVFLTQDSK